ncbi:DUF397 domain-containing protein [Streptomyces sp. I5]|nr:DUF397 domain-containing protein [Streptomyces sp. I5]
MRRTAITSDGWRRSSYSGGGDGNNCVEIAGSTPARRSRGIQSGAVPRSTRSGAPSPVSKRQHTAPAASARSVSTSLIATEASNSLLIRDVAAQKSRHT